MNAITRAFLLCTCALATSMAAANAEPVRVTGDGVQLACDRAQPLRLQCGYRLTAGGVASAIAVTLDTVTLPAPPLLPLAHRPSTAVLILVDTSDPARENVVAKNIKDVDALLAAATGGEHIGLAAFDSGLRMLAPPGTPRAQVRKAARTLRAVGMTTEGYRSALEAVHLLAAEKAQRRALIIFSDGQFEDRAYFDKDVSDAARAAGVAIYGIGYARSVELSVALQTLRRLAAETGGRFIEARVGRPLSEVFIHQLYAALESGGRFTVDLAPGKTAGLTGSGHTLTLRFTAKSGDATASLPVRMPAAPPPKPVVIRVPVPTPVPAAPVTHETAKANTPPPATTPKPKTRASAPAPVTKVVPAAAHAHASTRATTAGHWRYLAYAAGAALLVLLVLILAWALVRRRRPKTGARGSKPAAPVHNLAFLVAQDGSGARYAVTSMVFNIGRQADNDLVLDDNSISRHHAQIQRRRDGSFGVRDLDSLNGVFVNNKQVRDAPLNEDDLLEIGDVALRFTSSGASAAPAGEETVILKTALPSRPLPDEHIA